MTELYNDGYISKLKKNHAYFSAAFFVLTAVWIAVYVLSILSLGSLAVSIIIAVAGVLGLAVFYILLVAPSSAILKAVKEAAEGLKNTEKMVFLEYGEEQLKNGVYYRVMKAEVLEDGRAQERDLLVQKGLEPEMVRGEGFMGNTFQRVLLRYEKLGAENP